MKICTRCKERQSLQKRNLCRECYKIYKHEHYIQNKEHILQKTKQYKLKNYMRLSKYYSDYHKINRLKNPDYYKDRKLESDYGISLLDYKKLEKQQNFKCKICSKRVKLFVDHDHKSNKLRGLLCNLCNFGLGYFKDKITNLKNAIFYLENANAS